MVCTLAVHAAAIRMMFAMARDNNLAFSRQLGKVGGVLFVGAVIVVGVLMYRLKLRPQTGVLAEHMAPAANGALAGDPAERNGDLKPAR